jgi:ElaB/YqjD/DUF883 family membrane-anchored ribosome-binding protein
MTHEVTKDKLVADLKVVVEDAEELLKLTAGQVGEKATELRGKLQEKLKDAKVRLAEAEKLVIDKTKQAAKATDHFVHEHPWEAMGIAAGIGLIIGLLISRRD